LCGCLSLSPHRLPPSLSIFSSAASRSTPGLASVCVVCSLHPSLSSHSVQTSASSRAGQPSAADKGLAGRMVCFLLVRLLRSSLLRQSPTPSATSSVSLSHNSHLPHSALQLLWRCLPQRQVCKGKRELSWTIDSDAGG
jgi:hypothetical protein